MGELRIFDKDGSPWNFPVGDLGNGYEGLSGELFMDTNSSGTFKTAGLYVMEEVPEHAVEGDYTLERLQLHLRTRPFRFARSRAPYDLPADATIEAVNTDPMCRTKWISGRNVHAAYPVGSMLYFSGLAVSHPLGDDFITGSGTLHPNQAVLDDLLPSGAEADYDFRYFRVVDAEPNRIMIRTELANSAQHLCVNANTGAAYKIEISGTLSSHPLALIEVDSPDDGSVPRQWTRERWFAGKKVEVHGTQLNDGCRTLAGTAAPLRRKSLVVNFDNPAYGATPRATDVVREGADVEWSVNFLHRLDEPERTLRHTGSSSLWADVEKLRAWAASSLGHGTWTEYGRNEQAGSMVINLPIGLDAEGDIDFVQTAGYFGLDLEPGQVPNGWEYRLTPTDSREQIVQNLKRYCHARTDGRIVEYFNPTDGRPRVLEHCVLALPLDEQVSDELTRAGWTNYSADRPYVVDLARLDSDVGQDFVRITVNGVAYEISHDSDPEDPAQIELALDEWLDAHSARLLRAGVATEKRVLQSNTDFTPTPVRRVRLHAWPLVEDLGLEVSVELGASGRYYVLMDSLTVASLREPEWSVSVSGESLRGTTEGADTHASLSAWMEVGRPSWDRLGCWFVLGSKPELGGMSTLQAWSESASAVSVSYSFGERSLWWGWRAGVFTPGVFVSGNHVEVPDMSGSLTAYADFDMAAETDRMSLVLRAELEGVNPGTALSPQRLEVDYSVAPLDNLWSEGPEWHVCVDVASAAAPYTKAWVTVSLSPRITPGGADPVRRLVRLELHLDPSGTFVQCGSAPAAYFETAVAVYDYVDPVSGATIPGESIRFDQSSGALLYDVNGDVRVAQEERLLPRASRSVHMASAFSSPDRSCYTTLGITGTLTVVSLVDPDQALNYLWSWSQTSQVMTYEQPQARGFEDQPFFPGAELSVTGSSWSTNERVYTVTNVLSARDESGTVYLSALVLTYEGPLVQDASQLRLEQLATYRWPRHGSLGDTARALRFRWEESEELGPKEALFLYDFSGANLSPSNNVSYSGPLPLWQPQDECEQAPSVYLNSEPNTDPQRASDPSAQQTVFDFLEFPVYETDRAVVPISGGCMPGPTPIQVFVGHSWPEEGPVGKTLVCEVVQRAAVSVGSADGEFVCSVEGSSIEEWRASSLSAAGVPPAAVESEISQMRFLTDRPSSESAVAAWSERMTAYHTVLFSFDSEGLPTLTVSRPGLSFVDLGYEAGFTARITARDRVNQRGRATLPVDGAEAKISRVSARTLTFERGSAWSACSSYLPDWKVWDGELGEYVSVPTLMTVSVELEPMPFAKIRVWGQTETEDERYRVWCENLGLRVTPDDSRAFEESDVDEAAPDWTFLNRKRQELLNTWPEIYSYVGSYRSVIGAMSFFGWESLVLNEYYRNTDTEDPEFGKLFKVEIPDVFDRNVEGWNEVDYLYSRYPSRKYKKTDLLNLTYPYTDRSGGFVSPYTAEVALLKLTSLKAWIRRNVLPLTARILDVTGTAHLPSPVTSFSGNSSGGGLISSSSLCVVDHSAKAYLLGVNSGAALDTYVVHLEFDTVGTCEAMPFDLTVTTYRYPTREEALEMAAADESQPPRRFRLVGTVVVLDGGDFTGEFSAGEVVTFYSMYGGTEHVLDFVELIISNVTYSAEANWTTFSVPVRLGDREGGLCVSLAVRLDELIPVQLLSELRTDMSPYNLAVNLSVDPLFMVEVTSKDGEAGAVTSTKTYRLVERPGDDPCACVSVRISGYTGQLRNPPDPIPLATAPPPDLQLAVRAVEPDACDPTHTGGAYAEARNIQSGVASLSAFYNGSPLSFAGLTSLQVDASAPGAVTTSAATFSYGASSYVAEVTCVCVGAGSVDISVAPPEHGALPGLWTFRVVDQVSPVPRTRTRAFSVTALRPEELSVTLAAATLGNFADSSGSVSVAVAGGCQGGTFTVSLYRNGLLAETTTQNPHVGGPAFSFDGLAAGDYSVEARQLVRFNAGTPAETTTFSGSARAEVTVPDYIRLRNLLIGDNACTDEEDGAMYGWIRGGAGPWTVELREHTRLSPGDPPPAAPNGDEWSPSNPDGWRWEQPAAPAIPYWWKRLTTEDGSFFFGGLRVHSANDISIIGPAGQTQGSLRVSISDSAGASIEYPELGYYAITVARPDRLTLRMEQGPLDLTEGRVRLFVEGGCPPYTVEWFQSAGDPMRDSVSNGLIDNVYAVTNSGTGTPHPVQISNESDPYCNLVCPLSGSGSCYVMEGLLPGSYSVRVTDSTGVVENRILDQDYQWWSYNSEHVPRTYAYTLHPEGALTVASASPLATQRRYFPLKHMVGVRPQAGSDRPLKRYENPYFALEGYDAGATGSPDIRYDVYRRYVHVYRPLEAESGPFVFAASGCAASGSARIRVRGGSYDWTIWPLVETSGAVGYPKYFLPNPNCEVIVSVRERSIRPRYDSSDPAYAQIGHSYALEVGPSPSALEWVKADRSSANWPTVPQSASTQPPVAPMPNVHRYPSNPTEDLIDVSFYPGRDTTSAPVLHPGQYAPTSTPGPLGWVQPAVDRKNWPLADPSGPYYSRFQVQMWPSLEAGNPYSYVSLEQLDGGTYVADFTDIAEPRLSIRTAFSVAKPQATPVSAYAQSVVRSLSEAGGFIGGRVTVRMTTGCPPFYWLLVKTGDADGTLPDYPTYGYEPNSIVSSGSSTTFSIQYPAAQPTLPGTDLQPGTYTMLVTDSNTTSTSVEFEIGVSAPARLIWRKPLTLSPVRYSVGGALDDSGRVLSEQARVSFYGDSARWSVNGDLRQSDDFAQGYNESYFPGFATGIRVPSAEYGFDPSVANGLTDPSLLEWQPAVRGAAGLTEFKVPVMSESDWAGDRSGTVVVGPETLDFRAPGRALYLDGRNNGARLDRPIYLRKSDFCLVMSVKPYPLLDLEYPAGTVSADFGPLFSYGFGDFSYYSSPSYTALGCPANAAGVALGYGKEGAGYGFELHLRIPAGRPNAGRTYRFNSSASYPHTRSSALALAGSILAGPSSAPVPYESDAPHGLDTSPYGTFLLALDRQTSAHPTTSGVVIETFDLYAAELGTLEQGRVLHIGGIAVASAAGSQIDLCSLHQTLVGRIDLSPTPENSPSTLGECGGHARRAVDLSKVFCVMTPAINSAGYADNNPAGTQFSTDGYGAFRGEIGDMRLYMDSLLDPDNTSALDALVNDCSWQTWPETLDPALTPLLRYDFGTLAYYLTRWTQFGSDPADPATYCHLERTVAEVMHGGAYAGAHLGSVTDLLLTQEPSFTNSALCVRPGQVLHASYPSQRSATFWKSPSLSADAFYGAEELRAACSFPDNSLDAAGLPQPVTAALSPGLARAYASVTSVDSPTNGVRVASLPGRKTFLPGVWRISGGAPTATISYASSPDRAVITLSSPPALSSGDYVYLHCTGPVEYSSPESIAAGQLVDSPYNRFLVIGDPGVSWASPTLTISVGDPTRYSDPAKRPSGDVSVMAITADELAGGATFAPYFRTAESSDGGALVAHYTRGVPNLASPAAYLMDLTGVASSSAQKEALDASLAAHVSSSFEPGSVPDDRPSPVFSAFGEADGDFNLMLDSANLVDVGSPTLGVVPGSRYAPSWTDISSHESITVTDASVGSAWNRNGRPGLVVLTGPRHSVAGKSPDWLGQEASRFFVGDASAPDASGGIVSIGFDGAELTLTLNAAARVLVEGSYVSISAALSWLTSFGNSTNFESNSLELHLQGVTPPTAALWNAPISGNHISTVSVDRFLDSGAYVGNGDFQTTLGCYDLLNSKWVCEWDGATSLVVKDCAYLGAALAPFVLSGDSASMCVATVTNHALRSWRVREWLP